MFLRNSQLTDWAPFTVSRIRPSTYDIEQHQDAFLILAVSRGPTSHRDDFSVWLLLIASLLLSVSRSRAQMSEVLDVRANEVHGQVDDDGDDDDDEIYE